MGKTASLKKARELALEVEREYACSMIDEDVKDEKKKLKLAEKIKELILLIRTLNK